jgi:hypothetical protein
VASSGPTDPIAKKVFEDNAVVVVNSAFPLSTNVAKVDDAIPGVMVLDVKELWNIVDPMGAVLPCSVTARRRTPAPPACTTIVLESSSVWVSGGVPVAEAVTVQVPIVEPVTLATPLPGLVAGKPGMRTGVHPAPSQSPIDIKFAEAPDDHSSGLASSAAAVRSFLVILAPLGKKSQARD